MLVRRETHNGPYPLMRCYVPRMPKFGVRRGRFTVFDRKRPQMQTNGFTARQRETLNARFDDVDEFLAWYYSRTTAV